MTPAIKLSRLGRAAMAYATQFGWRVFPLHSVDASGCTCGSPNCTGTKPGKHPRTPRGCLDATTDAEQIRAWWSQWPDANVGVATGGGLVVIDIDPRHGGDEGFDELVERFGKIPDTVEALTGSKGRHIYLTVPQGVEVRNSAGVLAPGVDVRGEGGYVVAAPSSHVSGGSYAWELSSRPDAVDVAEAPRAWLDALARRPKLRVLPGGSGETVIEGARNDTLFKRACSMRSAGWDEPEILAALHAYNEAKCSPPLDPAEVKSIAASAARYEPNAPKPAVLPQAASQASERAPETPADSGWTAELYTTAKGAVRNTFANICTILRNDPATKSLRHNEMTASPELDGVPVSDARLALLREDIERRFGFSPSTDALAQAIVGVASESSYHPVRAYLDSLSWDGCSRLSHIATTMLGAEASDINVAMIRAWFVSAVARAFQPGCKVDTCLVLVGPQGARKSSFFRALGGQWFADTAIDLESKDAMQQINAAWIYELGEIDHVTSRAHAGRIKSFMTSQQDKYRLPFGRSISTVMRSNVIVGSTNEAQFLMDPTGSRRFWCVTVGRIDVDAVQAARDQLWAEAVEAFKNGENWWLDEALEVDHREAAETFAVVDPWEEIVRAAIIGDPEPLTARKLLVDVLKIEPGRIRKPDEMRLGNVLRRLGYERRVVRAHDGIQRVWVPIPVDDSVTA